MSEKSQYIEKAKAKLDQWNAEIDKMKAKIDEAEADAKIESQKQLNEMRAQRDEADAKLAEGEKDQRKRETDGYRLKRINEAEGDVARFSALLMEYNKAPEGRR